MDNNLEKDLEKGEDLTRVRSRSAPPYLMPSNVDPGAEYARMAEPPVKGDGNADPSYLETFKSFIKKVVQDTDAKEVLEDLETNEKSPHATVSPCAALEWEKAIKAF